MKSVEKEKAIRLRKEGKTYSEILAEIPVAKSTLSEWLKSVHLAKPQRQRLTLKRKDAALRGSEARRQTRISEVKSLERDGCIEIGKISNRELWLIGVALYWAEGSKQRETDLSRGVIFGNSDVEMIRVFIHWLHLMKVPESEYYFEIYIHESRKSEILIFKKWWASQLGVSVKKMDRVYLKKGNIKTNRKNIADLYHGLIRIKVNSSTLLNRKINGWVYGIVASLGGRLMVGQLPLKQ